MARRQTSWGAFLRLWLLMFFSYAVLKLLFDLAVMSYIDLRKAALVQLIVLPFGQTLVFWIVTRRARTIDEGNAIAE
jgi:hypothetical protein